MIRLCYGGIERKNMFYDIVMNEDNIEEYDYTCAVNIISIDTKYNNGSDRKRNVAIIETEVSYKKSKCESHDDKTCIVLNNNLLQADFHLIENEAKAIFKMLQSKVFNEHIASLK